MIYNRWIVRFIHKLFVCMAMSVALTAGCAPLPSPLAGEEGRLKPLIIASIETTEAEQGMQVVIQASRPFSYSLANHEKPPRVMVQIPDGQFARLTPEISVNRGVVRTIALQKQEGQAQVDIALERLVDYDVQKEENRLVLSFKDSTAAGSRREERDRPRVSGTEARPSGPGRRPESTSLLKDTSTPTGESAPSNPLEYVIGSTDVLEIAVYQEKDLSGTFRVSADGDIPFPLVGDVRVAGLTPPQAQQKLESLLREGYLKRPQVSVAVKEYHSKGVSVLGAVKKPGAYQLVGGRTTLLELLSLAEGVSLEEGSKSLFLLRADEGGEMKSTTIDLDRLLKDGDLSLNITVQPKDAIYVTKADAIIVYGEVQKPGTYPLESKEMTVLEALSKAGGLTKFAAPNRTRIVRVEGGVEKAIRVRVGDIIAKGEGMKDVLLQPGDVIVVPESYF